MSKEARKKLLEISEKLRDPDYRRQLQKEEAKKNREIWEKRTTCGCGTKMEQKGSWNIGEPIIGGTCYSKQLWQCPKCKNVEVL